MDERNETNWWRPNHGSERTERGKLAETEWWERTRRVKQIGGDRVESIGGARLGRKIGGSEWKNETKQWSPGKPLSWKVTVVVVPFVFVYV